MRAPLRWLGVAVPAALLLLFTLMAIAEIAAEPTPVPGVFSSTWTPLRGAASVIGGSSAFGGDWDFWPILFGALLLVGVPTLLGIVVLATMEWILGPEPDPVIAMIAGAAFGIVVQITVVMLLVDGLLDNDLMYSSLPEWAWWLATGTWGIALGALWSLRAAAYAHPPTPLDRSPAGGEVR